MQISKLKVLLFTTPCGLAKGRVKKPVFGMQPLGILYLATYLKRNADFECDIKICDAYTFGYNEQYIKKLVSSFKPHMVGVSSVTRHICDAQHICLISKEIDNTIVTVLGGSHPTALPKETVRDSNVDIVVNGEGELTFSRICKKIYNKEKWDSIEGIAFTKGSEEIINGGVQIIPNIDELPYPDLTMLPDIKYYNPAPVWGKKGNFTTMITSRGCPFDCSFCSVASNQGKKYRCQSAESIVDELIYKKNKFGITNVAFKDGTFTLNRKRIMEFCNILIKNNIVIHWSCNARADEYDIEMLKLMKSAGCRLIQIGIEQGNPNLIKKHKKVSREQVIKTTELAYQAGIDMHGFFMLGMPEENMSTMRETIDFSKQLKLRTANFSIFTPLPGTDAYDEILKNDGTLNEKWDAYDAQHKAGSWEHPNLSYEQLMLMRRTAFREFYLRPNIIINELRNINSCADVMNYVRTGLSFLF